MTRGSDDVGGRVARGAKGERTRTRLREAALTSFRERGYDATTMRAVAADAQVSAGAAYQYLSSKEDLVQEFYAAVVAEQRARVTAALDGERSFEARLRVAWHAVVHVLAPYHAHAGEFVAVGIRPGTDANPFSEASGATRRDAVALLEDVVAGARPAVPSAVRALLPEALWLAQLGLTLFWVADSSPGARRTHGLVDAAAALTARAVRLARLPVARPLIVDALTLVERARPAGGGRP
ncbi:TetR/AcrR family transcriptional regulator [Beutenbergia cavernae]|nr:TetR/AcrR family transcriptional regulator [Beutenbergia cavernae]